MDDPKAQELLAAARDGDRAALEALLERHQAQVYRFGMRMCRDPEDAKDVLQDTLLAMARGVRDFRGASSLSTWLYSVARSFCIKKRRRSKFAPAQEHSVERDAASKRVADGKPAPDEAMATRQVERALERAIAELEPMYREVLLLRDVEGLTAPEVAEVLGIGVTAVKSRLHRARLAVRAAIAPQLDIPLAEAPASPTCPDVLAMFSRHLEDDISAQVCAEMERHVQSCSRCAAQCDSLKRTLALCRTTAPTTEVPPALQESVKVELRRFLSDGT